MGLILALALTGPCHVVMADRVSDWLLREDAMSLSQAWALLGIESEVVCRPARRDDRVEA